VTFVTIERHDPEVGIKVVPMYLEGEDQPVEDEAPTPERVKTPALGIVAFVLGLLTLAALVTGIVIASAGDWRVGRLAAYAAVALSVLAVASGVVAVILGRGRRAGVIAVIVGILANPLVLLVILRFLGGIETG